MAASSLQDTCHFCSFAFGCNCACCLRSRQCFSHTLFAFIHWSIIHPSQHNTDFHGIKLVLVLIHHHLIPPRLQPRIRLCPLPILCPRPKLHQVIGNHDGPLDQPARLHQPSRTCKVQSIQPQSSLLFGLHEHGIRFHGNVAHVCAAKARR
ncbi:hypothetical protein BCR44DRAFT_392502 [Catenaria anguillulae PL171]|uniref:Uncharacterized protein n=1 Tax=Catenaria anguillulae PL171 TaxID=765915 RepID=A0A1Y2GY38_9FUNG|nr:hypothetical protein BCR44DRAFT_392502 [Catenaria anguillulae PL171]